LASSAFSISLRIASSIFVPPSRRSGFAIIDSYTPCITRYCGVPCAYAVSKYSLTQ